MVSTYRVVEKFANRAAVHFNERIIAENFISSRVDCENVAVGEPAQRYPFAVRRRRGNRICSVDRIGIRNGYSFMGRIIRRDRIAFE